MSFSFLQLMRSCRIFLSRVKAVNFKKNPYLKKKLIYLGAVILDVICILVVVVNGIQPAKRMVSPLVNSLQTMYPGQIKSTTEVFSFAPSLATNKFRKIKFEGLDNLAYFDVPVKADGSLNKQSKGYLSFKSDEALDLFNRARIYNTKVFLTVTQTNNESILKILNDPYSQQQLSADLVSEVGISGINGIVLDFEYNGVRGQNYKNKFTNLVAFLAGQLHSSVPGSKFIVAVPWADNSFYDLPSIANSSDSIFVLAYNFAVPEIKNQRPVNPIFGGGEKNYWDKVSSNLNLFLKGVPSDKLVLERAWYGNGENYPLYSPEFETGVNYQYEPTHILLDKDTVERLASGVPANARDAARRNIPLIGKALAQEGILDSNVLAYALATIEHETDGTFEPIEEIGGRLSARRRGYEGGINYFGRGFIQLTHLRNYKVVGERIGLGDRLVENPQLATDPEIAAKILAAFFKDNNIANLASKGYFVAARVPVNPDYNGVRVASLALKYVN